jgi:hypothetical protein
MQIRTLALLATVGATLGMAGCAGMGDEPAGLAGTGFGEDPWRQTTAARSSVVLPITQTGAGIAVIRQGLARARAAQAGQHVSGASAESQHLWEPTGEAVGSMPAQQADDDRRSGWGAQQQRANG